MQTITRIPQLAASIIPDVTEKSSYDYVSAVRNQIHDIIGRADVEATLRAAGLRTGTLTLVFTDRAKALLAAQAHREVGVFTLTDTDIPPASMTYITANEIQVTLDPDTLREWVVRVGFQEVLL